MEGHRHCQSVLIHQAIDSTVKKKFEGRRHIAPIGWGTDYQGITIPNQGQHPLGIVFRKHAIFRGAAFHTADAGTDIPALGKFDMNVCSQPHGLFLHQFKPFGNIAVPSRAGIDNQKIHKFIFFLATSLSINGAVMASHCPQSRPQYPISSFIFILYF